MDMDGAEAVSIPADAEGPIQTVALDVTGMT
jgi:hypothetical protein